MGTAGPYIVCNPRKASCPSGRDLLVLDGQRYSEGDVYTPPPGKDIKRFVEQGFLKEVGNGERSGSGGTAERDVPEVREGAGRSRGLAAPEAAEVPVTEEMSDV